MGLQFFFNGSGSGSTVLGLGWVNSSWSGRGDHGSTVLDSVVQDNSSWSGVGQPFLVQG